MSTYPDRLELLTAAANTTYTGIDFIYVRPGEVLLEVHFLQPPSVLSPQLSTSLTTPAGVTIYCPALNDQPVKVLNVSWTSSSNVLLIQVDQPGGFALYRLMINNAQIDPYYNDVLFSFKAGCPSRLDCAPVTPGCPEEAVVDFPIDYLSRDFWSFRRALLEFATLRYPDWPDRLEADAGMMVVELLSAVGDEMAYYQDRVGREAYLETASQRRSIRRLARLVDYTVDDGLGASAWIDVTVPCAMSGPLPAGTRVWAATANGQPVNFEIGHGLSEELANATYIVDAARNCFQPHIWDQSQLCLPVGTTQLYIEGNKVGALPFDDFPANDVPGKYVLLQTNPTNPAQQPRVQLVRLIQVTAATDPVLGDAITLIVWEAAQALPFEFDLTILTVRGNLVPATSGITQTAYFIVGEEFAALDPSIQQAFATYTGVVTPVAPVRAIEREGRDGTIAYRFTLPGTDSQGLVWLGADPDSANPEILLRQLQLPPGGNVLNDSLQWQWQRSLIQDDYTSLPESTDYTFDDGNWTRVVGYLDDTRTFVHRDYAAGAGLSILFGDGEFGLEPAPGSLFRVDYRLGGGNISNVPAQALKNITANAAVAALVSAVTNPLPAVNGVDPETPDVVRQEAPEAFQQVTYRAVRPEDYAAAAELLPWVQDAGAAFRWTGSWVSCFVTADPSGQIGLSDTQETDLEYQEQRYRQAGREVIIDQPVYANLDMEICVCARPTAYRGEVLQQVQTALMGQTGYPPVIGYFSPDRFTFGTLLERSTLEAAIQAVPGVLAVERIRYRRRGFFDWKVFTDLSYDPGNNTIICLANDPLHPEEGILTLNIHGGL